MRFDEIFQEFLLGLDKRYQDRRTNPLYNMNIALKIQRCLYRLILTIINDKAKREAESIKANSEMEKLLKNLFT